jgi:hypothetical protein
VYNIANVTQGRGQIAPPTIDIMIKMEADFVSASRPFIPKAKMGGNMIDIKHVIPIIA